MVADLYHQLRVQGDDGRRVQVGDDFVLLQEVVKRGNRAFQREARTRLKKRGA